MVHFGQVIRQMWDGRPSEPDRTFLGKGGHERPQLRPIQ
jgi:hypothetical protein